MRQLIVLVLLGVVACDGARASKGGAGLPTTKASPPYAEWSLDSTRVTRIGAVDGPAELQFSQVAYAARLSDGKLVVVDGGSDQVRWIDPDGHLEFQAGGRGKGPGELLRVVAATVTSRDSVVLYDVANQRLTWFGPEGSFSHTLHVGLRGAVALVPFEGKRLLVADEQPTYNFGGAEFNSTRDSLLIMMTGGSEESLDTLMQRPGREAVTWVAYADGKPTTTRQMGLPFGHTTLVGSAGNRIVLVEDGRRELTFFDRDGEAVRIAYRSEVNPPLLSSALRRQYVRSAVQKARTEGGPVGQAEAWAKHLLELIPEGQRVSAFDRMLTDPVSGRIWVRDYLLSWNVEKAERWTVYDSMGRVLARVTTPPGLDVMQVGRHHVVGVERGEMGVERVVSYFLETEN